MATIDRVREAQRAVQIMAIKRWQDRQVERQHNVRALASGGVGAADSPERVASYKVRQQSIARARDLRSLGLLPLGLERKIGPTLDWVPFAPSESARKAGRAVARLVDSFERGREPQGFATGFMVGTGLLLTNWHVFPSLADARGCGANFLYERDERGTKAGAIFELYPDRFYVSDEHLDFALVAVNSRALDGMALSDLGVVPLIATVPKMLTGQPINIIQYPDGGTKQYATARNRLVDILETGFLHYETDTLQGSSGAPAFGETWELVALHHAAIPEIRDGKVISVKGVPWSKEDGDEEVHWIANEGIRISALVERLRGIKLRASDQQRVLDGLIQGTPDPIDEISKIAVESAHPTGGPSSVPLTFETSGGAVSHNQFVFNGPVTIHVYAPSGTPTVPGDPKVPLGVGLGIEKVIRFDPDYDHRQGYIPAFLDPDGDIVVPTPAVTGPRSEELLKDEAGAPLILKYHHFELAMHKTRRLQMWSAVNVDYAPQRKSTRDRDAFGSDKWVPDPRIPAAAQIFDADFYKPAGNIDRGHVVRREDNAWGDSEEDIEFANSDTFHWTNCTPQHEAFNQSDPGRNDSTYRGMKGLWGDFENYVQQSRKGEDTKACILAGPVLDDEDPAADFGKGPVQYPLVFWKVICVVELDDDNQKTLRVFGFLLSQKDVVEEFGIEKRFTPGRFKKFQVALTAITQKAGVVFDDALHDADTYEHA